MTPTICPACRGPVERETVSRGRQGQAPVPCVYCPTCDLVTLIRPTAYEPADRRDLA